MYPTIVVIAYNRPNSLRRLLSSIDSASYDQRNISLCICIDYEDSNDNRLVHEIAETFVWSRGQKRVISQSRNLGLKAHVLKCGNLTNEYDSIIMLEDDLTVSPNFYRYSQQALTYYESDDRIAGVSLYNHKVNFINLLRFDPLQDEGDVYFLKIASSWGQAWTSRQWNRFILWYEKNQELSKTSRIPKYVANWPNSSWLKHYIDFCESTGSYFVYPRVSYSTNWSDAGTNNISSSTFFQVPLELNRTSLRMLPLDKSLARYDSYFELSPDIFTHLCTNLKGYDFEVDLYGQKQGVQSPYLLSSKKCKNPILSFGLKLKPMEFNIVKNVLGGYFSLASTNDFSRQNPINDLYKKELFNYNYGVIRPKVKLKNLQNIFFKRIFG